MAWIQGCAIGFTLVAATCTSVCRAETVVLRESAKVGDTAHVVIELKANGLYRPNSAPGAPEAKALQLKVETRFDFFERVLAVGDRGEAARVVRRVNQAASAINGEIRGSASSIRPEVAILAATNRETGCFSFSPGGPLTGSELELVQAPGDPLSLPGLLPEKAVGIGDTWSIPSNTVRALSDYDALASSTLRAKVESVDDATVRVRIGGEIRGAARGGEGTMTCDGTFTFNRKTGRIDRLNLNRAEVRKAGPVEAGLDLKGTLTVERDPAETPAELSDTALAELQLEDPGARALLLYSSPDAKYSLLHDREWHIFWDDTRMTVLKRLDHGEVTAQCNIRIGPNAGKGRHQDPAQFREDIRRALGKRFDHLLGEGEVEGAQADVYRYKVSVQGREGDADIIWYYYLLANPDGDQLLATFTLGEPQLKNFAEQDLQLIGTLDWKVAPRTAASK
jgi:hypothetical protein